jgi:hypothetical protein
MRRDALQAGVLDAELLTEQGQFVFPVDGGGGAVGRGEQGDPGYGEGVEDGGSSLPEPAWGKSRRETAVARHDRALLGKVSSITLRDMTGRCRKGTWRRGERPRESLA